VDKFKNVLRLLLPAFFIEWMKLFRELFLLPVNYIYDLYRYYRYSSTFFNFNNNKKARAVLLKDLHVIEKGLSLSQPRTGFGQVVVKRVIKYITSYLDIYGLDDVVASAINAVKEYHDFNERKGVSFKWLDDFLIKISHVESPKETHKGGTVLVKRNDILKKSSGTFEELASARCSIRVFDEKPVSLDFLKKAADIARKTPSVCNRQTANIFIFQDARLRSEILKLQGGNRGFGHLASHIVAITSDLSSFSGAGERNQAYVDGGLMAMTFVYALQSLGVGTCFLNWSVTAEKDVKLKKLTNIPSSHVVISLIAVGNIPSELRVARSDRLDISEILHLENNLNN